MTQPNESSLEILLVELLDETETSLQSAFELACDGDTNEATHQLRGLARNILAQLPDWELEDITTEGSDEQ